MGGTIDIIDIFEWPVQEVANHFLYAGQN